VYTIIPSRVSVRDGVLFLNDQPLPEAKIHAIDKNISLAVTSQQAFVLGRNADTFKMLDLRYKMRPDYIYVFDKELKYLGKDKPAAFVIKAMKENSDLQAMDALGKLWAEFRSSDLNPRDGLNIPLNNDKIAVKFKERQITARLQLFRNDKLPFIGIVIGGYDLKEVKRVNSENPKDRQALAMMALEKVLDIDADLMVVPSSPGTALGNMINKFNTYNPAAHTTVEPEPFTIKAKVWHSQKLLGLGMGSIKTRSDFQLYLSKSKLKRTVTVEVTESMCQRLIRKENKLIGKLGKRIRIYDVEGNMVDIIQRAQTINKAIDPAYSIDKMEFVHNTGERKHFVKFTINFNYHSVRTGDKILSYGGELFKGVIVVDNNIDPTVQVECTWDCIKGSEYKMVAQQTVTKGGKKYLGDYSIIEIDANKVQIVERGTSNARRNFSVENKSTDAYELMILHERYPEIAKSIAAESSDKYKTFAEAVNVFINRKITVNREISSGEYSRAVVSFMNNRPSLFDEDFKGGYVKVKDHVFPLPSTKLIEAMANVYDTHIVHHLVVKKYLANLKRYVARNFVNTGYRIDPKTSTAGLAYYTNWANKQLHLFYARPSVQLPSVLKRALNHMSLVMPTTVAVRDNDHILQNGRSTYCLASIYPSVHPEQVEYKIVRVIGLTMFKRMYFNKTGKKLMLTSLDDAVLLSPTLVNNIFIKDNDGDALSLRRLPNRGDAKKRWRESTKSFNEKLNVLNPIFKGLDDELWQKQKPKARQPQVELTNEIIVNQMSSGTYGKMMIGMITRQVRMTTLTLMRYAKEYPQHACCANKCIYIIGKAQQNVIDGLKHDTAAVEAENIYEFLRLFNNGNKMSDVEEALYMTPLPESIVPLLPELRKTHQSLRLAVSWLFGDPLRGKKSPSVRMVQALFMLKFPALAGIYHDKPISNGVLWKIVKADKEESKRLA